MANILTRAVIDSDIFTIKNVQIIRYEDKIIAEMMVDKTMIINRAVNRTSQNNARRIIDS